MAEPTPFVMPAKPDGATGCLVLARGDVLWGRGFGAHSDQERIVEAELHRFVRFHYDVVAELAGAD